MNARRRLLACVQLWPACVEGGYDPKCCRFPKSCSCEAGPNTPEAELEPRGDTLSGNVLGPFAATSPEGRTPASIFNGVRWHLLKTWPAPFAGVLARNKKHEIRQYDRDYRVGDLLQPGTTTPGGASSCA